MKSCLRERLVARLARSEVLGPAPAAGVGRGPGVGAGPGTREKAAAGGRDPRKRSQSRTPFCLS